jgi:catechol 2,3-dioxygenase-like lactoylglutathione lyase family enzyme
MDATRKGLGALTLFVEDLPAVTAFYRDVLELDVLFEDDVSAVFALGETALNVLDVSAAPELVAPTPVAAIGGAVQMMLTLWVQDVDSTSAELAQRGVTLLNGPMDRPWGKRTAAFTDPAGAAWEIAADIPRAAGERAEDDAEDRTGDSAGDKADDGLAEASTP